MSTPATLIAESTLGTNESISNLVVETRPEDTSIAIVCADGATFTVSRLIGSHVRKGDELIVPLRFADESIGRDS